MSVGLVLKSWQYGRIVHSSLNTYHTKLLRIQNLGPNISFIHIHFRLGNIFYFLFLKLNNPFPAGEQSKILNWLWECIRLLEMQQYRGMTQ